MLWIGNGESFRSRGLQREGGKWQWRKGDYDEEISWFPHSLPGLGSMHYYLCTRVPGGNHWCKLLLSPRAGVSGDSLELLDLLRPVHKDRDYDSATYAQQVLEGSLKPTCRYQRIARSSLNEDEVAERVRALKRPALTESEQP